jgi:hypothetical protein
MAGSALDSILGGARVAIASAPGISAVVAPITLAQVPPQILEDRDHLGCDDNAVGLGGARRPRGRGRIALERRRPMSLIVAREVYKSYATEAVEVKALRGAALTWRQAPSPPLWVRQGAAKPRCSTSLAVWISLQAATWRSPASM